MKTMLKFTATMMLAMLVIYPSIAQNDKQAEKELTSKALKQARKQAKEYTKQGYFVAPGAVPLDKQIENSWLMQYEKDEKGNPKYILETGNSVAGSQAAAKIQATETAKLSIASNITTQVAALIEINIANQQLNNEEAATVNKIVAAAKTIIAQELGRTVVIVEMYKKVDKNIEANIRLAYDLKNAKEVAKTIIRKKLEDESKILQDKLDKIMKID